MKLGSGYAGAVMMLGSGHAGQWLCLAVAMLGSGHVCSVDSFSVAFFFQLVFVD